MVRYIWEHPTEYNILNIKAPKNKNYPDLRLTVDYPEDFELAMNIYSHFNKIDFTSTDIIDLYKNDKKLFEGVSKLVQHSAPFIKED